MYRRDMWLQLSPSLWHWPLSLSPSPSPSPSSSLVSSRHLATRAPLLIVTPCFFSGAPPAPLSLVASLSPFVSSSTWRVREKRETREGRRERRERARALCSHEYMTRGATCGCSSRRRCVGFIHSFEKRGGLPLLSSPPPLLSSPPKHASSISREGTLRVSKLVTAPAAAVCSDDFYCPCCSGASLIMSSMRRTVMAASVANWIILTFDKAGSRMPACRLFWILPEMQSIP